MTTNQTTPDPAPKPGDSPSRDPEPAPGPSFRPTSVGQSQKSLKSEIGKTRGGVK
jgi:hypothetical protein